MLEKLVREERLELSNHLWRQDLNLVRLPIPPLSQFFKDVNSTGIFNSAHLTRNFNFITA